MNVDTPLYGWVTSSMLAPFGEPLDLARYIHPRVEPEIAFLLGRDLAAPATVTSVLAATEAVFAAVDVLDSRYENFRFTLSDVVADNASAGAFLIGPKAVRPDDVMDLALIGCVLRVDGVAVAEPSDAGVARRRVQFRERTCTSEVPREGVLASTRSDEKHLHSAESSGAGGGFERCGARADW
jgi:2-oxo-3-hexenedioate decarboxylase